jgi:hypothetical protein
MTRYVFCCGFDTSPSPAIHQKLGLTDQLRFTRGELQPELWMSRQELGDVEAELAGFLTGGQVRSAALLPTVPAPEQQWMLDEWRGRLVTHRVLADQPDQRYWTLSASLELIDMHVFSPAGRGRHTTVTSQPGEQPGHWVETVTEYRASLETNRPTLIIAPVRQIVSKLPEWFGDLADDRIGGAITILALSGVTASPQGLVVLRNPAAFGLRRVTGTTSLAARREAGKVSLRAWGTNSPDPTKDVTERSYERLESRSLSASLGALRTATGARYGLLARLTATEDLELRIDTGLVFEQEALNGVQSLAVAAGERPAISASRPVTMAFPAWCLNRRLAAPAGQPVRPTPFFLPLPVGTDQSTVWRTMERTPDPLQAPA